MIESLAFVISALLIGLAAWTIVQLVSMWRSSGRQAPSLSGIDQGSLGVLGEGASDHDENGFYSPHAWSDNQLTHFAAELGGVDLGVVQYVKVLRDSGIETFESCQGGEGHAFPAPTVRFLGNGAQGWKALSVCLDHGLGVRSLRRYWQVSPEGEPDGPNWELTFRDLD